MKRTAILIGIVATVTAVVATVFLGGIGQRSPPGRADPTDPQAIALGERVYREHCAACHGTNLEGQRDWQSRRPDGRLPAPPHDETGHTWHHADEVLFRITKEGVAALVPGYESDMPAYADTLTDNEIWAVLAYIKSRWPPAIQARQADINRRTGQD
ncbi:c-type cytochrome [Telmatospirillum sp. J64-1]|uniref:c-type cytochrome n=1 Tax=Telmatospirillum sp. J64-1 TaxID=2502183 RepID=UPI00115DEC76|nr:c-type cytochrome [Telmatospirillum sp. J64-1]